MDYRFWGVRGTFPVPAKGTVRYGGHTHCASVDTPAGTTIVVDSGTGIRDLGARLMAESAASGDGPMEVAILLTHFHLDHIIGFPFFAPLFSSRASITVYAAADRDETKAHLGGLMAGRYFPVGIEKLPAAIRFERAPAELVIDGVRITQCPLIHPQGSVAYRLEQDGASVVSATDTEHPDSGLDERLASFASGADLLIYDTMYTPGEYEAGKKGWGHSTWLAGAALAEAAGVRHLVLAHYDPDHSDERIDGILAETRRRSPGTLAAAQGLTVSVGPNEPKKR